MLKKPEFEKSYKWSNSFFPAFQIDGHDSGTESDGDLEDDDFNQEMDLSKYPEKFFFFSVKCMRTAWHCLDSLVRLCVSVCMEEKRYDQ